MSRARRAGLLITPRAVFQHQTVVALAAVAGFTVPAPLLPELATGGLPPTPIMRWLQERGGPIERFNQTMLLQVPAGMRAADLTAVLQVVLDHHDALRLRLTATAGAKWSLEVAPVGAVAAADCLQRIDISALADEELRACIAAQAQAAQDRLAPMSGRMLQGVWFDAGAKRSGRLLVTIHHLSVDGVSWRILVPDLAAAWSAISDGREASLPARGTSFRGWAQRLALYAQQTEVAEELSFWRGMLGQSAPALYQGVLDPARDVGGSAKHLMLTLPSVLTGALLTRVAAAFHGGINDVLLTGLVLAVADWRRRHSVAGADAEARHAVLLDLEGHGREEIFANVDLSRTVGWFTSLFPVRLDAGALDLEEALAGGSALGVALKRVKEQLRALPERGLGYGLLRYLNAQTGVQLAGDAVPQLGFNYLGRMASEAGDWSAAAETIWLGGGDLAMPLAHGLEINALTLDGADGPRLRADWSWAPALLTETAVRELAESWFGVLAALVRHVAQPGAGGRSPSDLPLVALTQGEIERLEREHPQLEDILPLSPLQEGLLFHALYDAQAPDVYTVQLDLELVGALDGAALALAAQALLERHASLRACFQHEQLGRPVQIIEARVLAPWRTIDLSGFEEAEREQRLADILTQDRAEHFDVASAPLLRFALIRLSTDRHRLVLTHHHLLMDGWSAPVLVRELLALYGRQAEALPQVTPYRDYLAFIARQDRDAALTAWREALAGLEEPTRLAQRAAGGALVVPEQIILALEEGLSRDLSAAARAQALTLNTMIQATWAVLLGRLTGRDDVVFGVTVAGRPAEIAGVESMVGLFINTLPLRIALPPAKPLCDLLRDLQERQSQLMAHQHLGLAEIQKLAALGELFDTLVVFENYPVDRAGLAGEVSGVRLATVRGHDATHYPLSLLVQPGERLVLRLDYRPDLFDRETVTALGARLIRLLEAAVAEPQRAIGGLDILVCCRAPHHCTGLERHRAADRGRYRAGVVCGAGAAHAGGGCGGVRGSQPELCGAGGARQSTGASAARSLGVGPETMVGLCVERSPEMVIGLLGILKAGGAYLPLDPEYPAERLAFMLSDAGATVLLTQSGLIDRLAAVAAATTTTTRIVRIDADWPDVARQPTSAPKLELHPQHPAYVIYTSGSTGTPKGVVVSHGGLAQLRLWSMQRSTWRLRQRIGCCGHTLGFDIAALELFCR